MPDTMILCPSCGEALDAEETADPRLLDQQAVCDDCYREHAQYICCWCEDDEENEYQHTALVVTAPAEVGLGLPGLYRIDTFPYYWRALLDGGIYADAVTWLGYLAASVNEGGAPCGHLCRACQQEARAQIAQTTACGMLATLRCEEMVSCTKAQ